MCIKITLDDTAIFTSTIKQNVENWRGEWETIIYTTGCSFTRSRFFSEITRFPHLRRNIFGFSQLPQSVGLCLLPSLGSFQASFLQTSFQLHILCLLLLGHQWWVAHSLSQPYTSWVSGHFFFFFNLLSVCGSDWERQGWQLFSFLADFFGRISLSHRQIKEETKQILISQVWVYLMY